MPARSDCSSRGVVKRIPTRAARRSKSGRSSRPTAGRPAGCRVVRQLGDGAVTLSDRLEVDARSHEPVPEKPGSHPCPGAVEDAGERALPVVRRQRARSRGSRGWRDRSGERHPLGGGRSSRDGRGRRAGSPRHRRAGRRPCRPVARRTRARSHADRAHPEHSTEPVLAGGRRKLLGRHRGDRRRGKLPGHAPAQPSQPSAIRISRGCSRASCSETARSPSHRIPSKVPVLSSSQASA